MTEEGQARKQGSVSVAIRVDKPRIQFDFSFVVLELLPGDQWRSLHAQNILKIAATLPYTSIRALVARSPIETPVIGLVLYKPG